MRGNLGDYPVEGVVSGKKAYLLVSQGGWFYYRVVLEMPAPNILIGYCSRSVPYEVNKRVDMRLDRLCNGSQARGKPSGKIGGRVRSPLFPTNRRSRPGWAG